MPVKMTARELIEQLEKLPPETVIYVMDDYNAEPVNIERFEPFAVRNPNDPDTGKYVLWPGQPDWYLERHK